MVKLLLLKDTSANFDRGMFVLFCILQQTIPFVAVLSSWKAPVNSDPSLVVFVCVSLNHWHGFSTPEQAQGLSHRKVSVVLLSLHHHPSRCLLCMCVPCMHFYCTYVCTRIYVLMTSPPEGLHEFHYTCCTCLLCKWSFSSHSKKRHGFHLWKNRNISVSFCVANKLCSEHPLLFGILMLFGAPLKVWIF